MKGYLLFADGTRLEGALRGAARQAVGWMAANTGVVGFQEMATDSAYMGQILALTYPEIGNVGVAERFSESDGARVAGMVVKVLAEHHSHYLAEGSFEDFLSRHGVPCLSGIDTRFLAVHLRENGEMPAAIVPAEVDLEQIRAALVKLERPRFAPCGPAAEPAGEKGPNVAVLNLGVRRSHVQQLDRCCRATVLPYDAGADAVLAVRPAGVFVSDGPGCALPPQQAVETLKALVCRVPILACGLGQVALGLALGCEAEPLKQGHHGANYSVRNVLDGSVEITVQRHSVALKRESVNAAPEAELLWENMNDGTVEGIRTPDGSAVGLQAMLASPNPTAVNGHILDFVEGLAD